MAPLFAFYFCYVSFSSFIYKTNPLVDTLVGVGTGVVWSKSMNLHSLSKLDLVDEPEIWRGGDRERPLRPTGKVL